MKKVIIRIPERLCQQILNDLLRVHCFAYERVGFVIGRSKDLPGNKILILLTEYIPIPDELYIDDDTVGARINSEAIRCAMQIAMDRKCSIFHVHKHFGNGMPSFSKTDLVELPGIAEAMVNANPENVHGVLLLSEDSADVILKVKPSKGKVSLEKIVRVGYPMSFNNKWYQNGKFDENRYDRQSFLGKWSQHKLSKIKVGVIGLGGGGSHIIQQLAHLGVLNFVLFDDDHVENSNLNRLVGATNADSKLKVRKTDIAYRLIIGIQPNANIEIVNKKWQEQTDSVQTCDIILGAVDSFAGRRDIELECRRYFIPYIDIGMDVRIVSPDPPRLYGQVILSLPGEPCMQCIEYLTDHLLAKEAEKYGDAGKHPQVIWSNGVLASNAVGIFVDLITGWSKKNKVQFFQEYDGNAITLVKSYRLNYLGDQTCPHYPLIEAGPINWNKYKT